MLEHAAFFDCSDHPVVVWDRKVTRVRLALKKEGGIDAYERWGPLEGGGGDSTPLRKKGTTHDEERGRGKRDMGGAKMPFSLLSFFSRKVSCCGLKKGPPPPLPIRQAIKAFRMSSLKYHQGSRGEEGGGGLYVEQSPNYMQYVLRPLHKRGGTMLSLSLSILLAYYKKS